MAMRYLGGGPYHTILRGIINIKDTLQRILGSSRLAAEEDEDDSGVNDEVLEAEDDEAPEAEDDGDDEAPEAEDNADDGDMSEVEFDLGAGDERFGWNENDGEEDNEEEEEADENEGSDDGSSAGNAEDDGWVVGRLSGYYH